MRHLRTSTDRYRYYVIYKPYGFLSRFTTDQPGQSCLADLTELPKDVYPIGRLDQDSEGLLLLSSDPQTNAAILSPAQKLVKTYCCQVEGNCDDARLQRLLSGFNLNVKGTMHFVQAVSARVFAETPILPPRDPPIRFRKNIPTSWVEIGITEGKNRQVRKMLASIGFPVLRLVRIGIGKLQLGTMQPGELREFKASEFFQSIGFRRP
ncbi:MAG: pseudouridine synthase [Saprospiraceae bacterium]|nr:pseudouridine synthase [Saprospiraceae bacterium]MBP9209461.1 pseudouridine synthase [Saprospiraceae bacterium]